MIFAPTENERTVTGMAEYIDRVEAIAWFMPYVQSGESIESDVVISDLKCMKLQRCPGAAWAVAAV